MVVSAGEHYWEPKEQNENANHVVVVEVTVGVNGYVRSG